MGKDIELLGIRVALLQAYRAAASAGDQRSLEAATVFASKRRLPPKVDVASVVVSGLQPAVSKEEVFSLDLIQPEINGRPHWISNAGWHLYLGRKSGRVSWVLDECCSENEATGHAFREAGEHLELPCGVQVWQCWDEFENRHM